MKYYFPPQNQTFRYLQTNRSDRLGSIWSSFNLDFKRKLGSLKLSNKLVTNTTSVDDADLGLPVAFDFFWNKWFAICGTKIFKSTTANGDLVTGFTKDVSSYAVGDATTRFDITNPVGTTFRYTYDGTGTDPGITALTFPINGTVGITTGTNFAAGNKGFVKTITGSGANYFEVTNAGGSAESDKTLATGILSVYGGTLGTNYNPNYSDLCIFDDKIFATTETTLCYKEDDSVANINTFGSWFQVDTFSAGLHKMLYFKVRDRLYYMSSSTFIRSVDSTLIPTLSSSYTLDLTNSIGSARTFVSNTNSIWIGTLRFNDSDNSSRNNVSGAILQWDGFSSQVSNEFPLASSGVLSMVVLNDVPYAIDTLGRILKYTGYSFQEVARLPLDEQVLLNISNATATNGFPVHYNGMTTTENNTIQILINNLNGDKDGTINENLPSGIWEFDAETNNLTHKSAPTLKSMSSATTTDYGQNRVLSVGALKNSYYESDSASGRSTLIAGIKYYTDLTTDKTAIFIDSPSNADTDNEGQKRGYFVTTWFESSEITDNWLRLWAVYKKFANATDKLKFKYRLDEEDPLYANITWTSTTQFTTTTDVSAYNGYEVEIIQGTGSGSCNQISNITSLAGTYTVTIDSVVSGVTGTAIGRFQKWIKLGELSGTIMDYGQLPIINKSSTKIQIKGVLEWTGDSELIKMILNSTSYITVDS